jgi:hypothetical protein
MGRLTVVELGESDLRVGIDEGLLIDAPDAFHVADVERVLGAAVARMLTLEFAVRLLFRLGFPLAQVHQLEIVERLIRHGAYMGPLNMAITCYGGGGCGYNPFDWMEFIRRTPQSAIATF